MKTLRETMEEAEREYLRAALVEGGTVIKAAQIAGVCRQTFHRRMSVLAVRSASVIRRGNWLDQACTATPKTSAL